MTDSFNRGSPKVMSSSTRTRECIIPMRVGSETVPVLIDSGSTDCFAGPELIKHLPDAGKKLYRSPQLTTGTVASGEKFVCHQAVNLDVEICGEFVPITAHYSDKLKYALILGYNILKEHKLIIDFDTLSITRKPDSQIKLVEAAVLPPLSETVLQGYVRDSMPLGVSLITSSSLLNNKGLIAANAIVDVERDNDVVPVKVINLSEEETVLPAHFYVADCNQISASDVIEHDEQTAHSTEKKTPAAHDNCGYRSKEQFAEQFVRDNPSVSDTEWSQLVDLLWEFRDVIPADGQKLGVTNVLEFKIMLRDDARPLKARPYRSNPTVRREISKQVRQMMEDGIIRPSTSNYVSPVLLVAKADGSLRFVTDFRKNNSQNIIPETATLPRIDCSLESLGSSRAKLFSTLDLLKGYWQVPIAEDSKKYTAFVTHDGVFEYNRMPFGLANSPACFMRLMTRVLQGLMWETCLVYLDDVIIFSADFPEHLERLRQILTRIRDANLSIKAKKCAFMRRETKFLGHMITSDGILPLAEKIEAIKNFPRPSSLKEVQSFLGLVGYYRKFIQDFSTIAGPLHELARKDVEFKWTDDCEQAYNTLREALMQPPVLAYPDYDKPYTLETDASDDAVGFVLSQEVDGKQRPIAYSGKRMNDAQKNYSTTEKEAMAVVLGFQQFDSFLRGNQVRVITDHVALKWLLTHKQPKGRVARWIAYLQQFDFTVEHKAGKEHKNADALSRIPHVDEAEHLEQKIDEDLFPTTCAITRSAAAGEAHAAADNAPAATTAVPRDHVENNRPKLVFPTSQWTLEDLRKHQLNDESTGHMMRYIQEGTLPENEIEAREILLSHDQYVVNNGVLYKICQPSKKKMKRVDRIECCLVVPTALKHDVLTAHHSELCQAHFGYRRTYATLQLKYYWKGMFADTYKWVVSCVKCNTKKHPVRPIRALLNPLPPTHVGERWAMDLINMPKSDRGNRYILTFTEYNTRFVEAFPLQNSQAVTIARVLVEEICFRYGAPGCILSDLGANLIASVVSETCRLFNIERVHTAPYRPQTNSVCEKWNDTLTKNLAMYVNPHHTDWDLYIRAICYAYNSTVCTESTQFTPFYLMYGRMPLNPLDTVVLPSDYQHDDVKELIVKLQEARELARQNIVESQQTMKQRYDKKANPQDFEPGDLVWIYFPQIMVGGSRKFLHNYSGPYILLEKINPVDFTVAHAHNGKRLKNVIHVNRMKRFYHRSMMPPVLERADVTADVHDVEDLSPIDRGVAERLPPQNESIVPSGIEAQLTSGEAPIDSEQGDEQFSMPPLLEPIEPVRERDIEDTPLEPPHLEPEV